MEYRILGPVTVLRDGEALTLSPKVRALLVFLLLAPGQCANQKTILRQLWPEVRGNDYSRVHRHSSILRRVLGEKAHPVQNSESYRIVAHPDSVDLLRFRRGLECAQATTDPMQKVHAFERALLECQGDPFLGVDDPCFDQARRDFVSDWQQAEAEYLEALLEIDAVAKSITECRHAIDRWPEELRFYDFFLRTAYFVDGARAYLPIFEEYRGKASGKLRAALDAMHTELEAEAKPARPVGNANSTTAPPAPQQLPAQRPIIVGHKHDLQAVCSVLANESSSRIVGLVGPAGIGKSALAFRGASSVLEHFPDGVLYADLQGFSEHEPMKVEQVLARFLADLGVTPQNSSADGLGATFRSALAERPILVVLDNARDAPHVIPLLPGRGPSAVIVTSRDALVRLTVEYGADRIVVALLTPEECLQLLTSIIGEQRVHAEIDAATEVMRYCGGLPLAVVVIAARLLSRHALSMEEVLHELTSATRKFTAFVDDDTALSLRVVLAYSHRVLSGDAASLLWRLGVHPGPTISRGAAVHLGMSPNSGMKALVELRRAHLVEEVSYDRFAMHDLVRAYAEEKSDEAGEAERRLALERLLDYLMYQARDCDEGIVPGRGLRIGPTPTDLQLEPPNDVDAALKWFNAEYDVIMAAIELAVRHDLHQYAWLLPLTLTTFQWRSNRYLDAQRVLQMSLHAAQIVAAPADQAMILRLIAGTDRGLGRRDLAKIRLANVINLAEDDGDELGVAHGLHALAVLHRETGDTDSADQRFHAALTIFRRLGNDVGEAGALNGIGCVHADRGQYEQALRTGAEALVLFKRTTDENGQANTLDCLAGFRLATGDILSAITDFEAAVAIYQRLEYRKKEAQTLERLADAQNKSGNVDGERRSLVRALALLRELRDPAAQVVARRLEELP